MKKQMIGVLIAAMLTALTGCSQHQEAAPVTAPEDEKPSGILVPVAQFQSVKEEFTVWSNYCWMDDSLLYSETTWIEEINDRKRTLYRAKIDGTGDPEIVLEEVPGELYFDVFLSDCNNSLFLFGRENKDGDMRHYIKKITPEGEEEYCTYTEQELPNLSGPASMRQGYADSLGNILLLSLDGYAYLFDRQGRYLDCRKLDMNQPSFLDAGEEGVFLWERNYETDELNLTEIDWENGVLKEPFIMNIPGLEDRQISYTLLSGREMGILLSTEEYLYQYDPDTGTKTELLNWQAGTVNIDGSDVLDLRLLEENTDGTMNMKMLCYNWQESAGEVASIEYVDQAYVPQRETLTLGVSYSLNLGKTVRRFNRTNQKYEVVIKEYDTGTMEESLMYGKDDVPDLLDIKWITPDLLVNKGLLEDLEPYFQQSTVVNKEDIMESVWNAGIINGKMVGSIRSFSIQSQSVWADEIPETGWAYEDLFALNSAYPESRLINYCSPASVYQMLMYTGMDEFVDFRNGTCSFDSQDFIELLKSINGLNYPETSETSHSRITYLDDEIKKFLSGEFAVMYDFYNSPYQYQTTMDKYEGKARNVGYPTQNGEPCFIINPTMTLSIYSNSPCREGAWAFIEFLLSEEEQSWYGRSSNGFPARREAFEAYLNKPCMPGTVMMDEKPSEEYREDLRYMVQHLYTNQSINTNSIIKIMYEEIEAYFKGGKTAEEAAAIIQNRVQLYLDEMA